MAYHVAERCPRSVTGDRRWWAWKRFRLRHEGIAVDTSKVDWDNRSVRAGAALGRHVCRGGATTCARGLGTPATDRCSGPSPGERHPRPPVEMVVEDEFLPALEDVAVSCGLDARPFCQDEACVALMRMPDLDRINGWVSMAYRSPRFVWSVVRRDMGVPEEVLSCGAAFDRLDRVASVALADGDEIWCAFDGSESQATLCDMAAAQRYGLSGAEFRRDDLRYLSFERP